MVDHWLKNSLNMFLPQVCLLCGGTASPLHDLALCDACIADLPVLGETCLRCANPLEPHRDKLGEFLYQPALLQTRQCGQCLSHPPHFDHTVAFFPYTTPFNHFIQSVKFKGKLATARLLGKLFAQQLANCIDLQDNKPDGILPVPLHPSRQRERGYNQALEIALPVAKHLRIPILNNLASRIKATPAQTSLSLQQRKQNLQRAFVIHREVREQHIVIIDDVMTSGTTVNTLAQNLKQAGARQVSVWCLSRAEPP